MPTRSIKHRIGTYVILSNTPFKDHTQPVAGAINEIEGQIVKDTIQTSPTTAGTLGRILIDSPIRPTGTVPFHQWTVAHPSRFDIIDRLLRDLKAMYPFMKLTGYTGMVVQGNLNYALTFPHAAATNAVLLNPELQSHRDLIDAELDKFAALGITDIYFDIASSRWVHDGSPLPTGATESEMTSPLGRFLAVREYLASKGFTAGTEAWISKSGPPGFLSPNYKHIPQLTVSGSPGHGASLYWFEAQSGVTVDPSNHVDLSVWLVPSGGFPSPVPVTEITKWLQRGFSIISTFNQHANTRDAAIAAGMADALTLN